MTRCAIQIDVYFTLLYFVVWFVVVTARCGGWTSGPNGTVTSPGYPSGTETGSIECSWTIQVPRGHYVQLTFTELSLENPGAGGQCTSDNFIEIRDYNDTGAPHVSLVRLSVCLSVARP